ncbi:S-protein homolog 2-like [Punica granatum]|nr:S-protein homolog 2-like [Punica granatum]PKI33001.1 hypothetical protein CRG98_046616 [Punica granatum]
MSQKYASPIILVFLLMLWNQGTIFADAQRGPLVTSVRVIPIYGADVGFNIHCKSSSGVDLGDHLIVKGGTYGIDITPSQPGKTIYLCSVQWQGRGVAFVIYSEDRDYNNRCNNLCLWAVREDGVVGQREDAHGLDFDLHFPWTQ